MLGNLEPISVDSVSFIILAGGLALLVRFHAERFFLGALVTAGTFLTLSWLGWRDLIALILFLPIPYLTARMLWGRRDLNAGVLLILAVVGQILLFLIIKRYTWFDFLGWVDHPVSVVGVSYILFRQLHLIVDSRFFGELPFTPLRYIGYILSPWTLIAGPIQRYDAFCAGMDKVAFPEREELLAASHRIINGFLLAFVAAPLFLNPSRISNLAHPDANWVDVLVIFYGFPLYLYFNFAGYTSIMIGAARLCGFSTLPENFNHPYLASNSRDFWNRWHISFGVWIKTYVFTPVCTWLMKVSAPRYHWLVMLVAVLIAFYFVGVWHGTTINYLIFGILQGFGVIVSALFEQMRKRALGAKRSREFNNFFWFRAISIFITLHFTCFTFLLLNDHPDRLIESMVTFFS